MQDRGINSNGYIMLLPHKSHHPSLCTPPNVQIV